MNLGNLAVAIFDRAEDLGVAHMAVGAIAAGTYGIPRATKDIDLLVSVDLQNGIHQLIAGLSEIIEFEAQSQFAAALKEIRTQEFDTVYKRKFSRLASDHP